MDKKIELLAPAGSLANLKAAVSKGADAVYLGMKKFSAREYATNFNKEYLKKAVSICKSNNVRLYLAMNTLVKNNELKDFFSQLSYAYSSGIDSVIIQETSFIGIIRKNYPDLKVHISTQAGVMNSIHAALLKDADRITLARELKKEEIKEIRKNYPKELEIFCHGALCVSVSGSCLFSSLLGGRSGNRGKCAQPCRKKYNDCYYLSLKELCLINKIPEIIETGVNCVKIEGRMRAPYYVASAVSAYREAIDNFYAGRFEVRKETIIQLKDAFTREFTEGKFSNSQEMFNREKATGMTNTSQKEMYEVKDKNILINKKCVNVNIPLINNKKINKQLLVRVYNKQDALDACSSGADIIYLELFDEQFNEIKKLVRCKLFAVTPRLMFDSDFNDIIENIKEKNPDGLLVGNAGLLKFDFNVPVHVDYSFNCFNDIDVSSYSSRHILPIISPELSIAELKQFHDKSFAVFVHGKIKLMTLRHELEEGWIKDEKGESFKINKVYNGSEIINRKELGLLGKCSSLANGGINNFFIDTDKNVKDIVSFYRNVLDGNKVNDKKLRKKYVLGWSYKGVI